MTTAIPAHVIALYKARYDHEWSEPYLIDNKWMTRNYMTNFTNTLTEVTPPVTEAIATNKSKLLVKHTIPHTYYVDGKSIRLSLNRVLTMNWRHRKIIHDLFTNQYSDILQGLEKKSISDSDKFRISFGFYSDVSTKNCDLDNIISYLGKIYIDCFSKYYGINDSYRRIPEVRIVYLGLAEIEKVVAQVELLT